MSQELRLFSVNLSFMFCTEKINLKNAHEYKYLQQSNCYTIPGVNDAEQFRIAMVVYPKI